MSEAMERYYVDHEIGVMRDKKLFAACMNSDDAKTTASALNFALLKEEIEAGLENMLTQKYLVGNHRKLITDLLKRVKEA